MHSGGSLRIALAVATAVLTSPAVASAACVVLTEPSEGPARFDRQALRKNVDTYLEDYQREWRSDGNVDGADYLVRFDWGEGAKLRGTIFSDGQSVGTFAVLFRANPDVNFYRAVAIELRGALQILAHAPAPRVESPPPPAPPPPPEPADRLSAEIASSVLVGSGLWALGLMPSIALAWDNGPWFQGLSAGYGFSMVSNGSVRSDLLRFTLALGRNIPLGGERWMLSPAIEPGGTLASFGGAWHGDLFIAATAKLSYRLRNHTELVVGAAADVFLTHTEEAVRGRTLYTSRTALAHGHIGVRRRF